MGPCGSHIQQQSESRSFFCWNWCMPMQVNAVVVVAVVVKRKESEMETKLKIKVLPGNCIWGLVVTVKVKVEGRGSCCSPRSRRDITFLTSVAYVGRLTLFPPSFLCSPFLLCLVSPSLQSEFAFLNQSRKSLPIYENESRRLGDYFIIGIVSSMFSPFSRGEKCNHFASIDMMRLKKHKLTI